MKILVVEDNEDMLANICEFFEPRGHKVFGASDGNQGLELAVNNTYDAIILDLMLPGISGIDICRKIRKTKNFDIPILMMTARDGLEETVEGFQAGTDDYIVKPVAMPELEARLIAVMRRSSHSSSEQVLQISNLTFDAKTLEVKRGGNLIRLNPTTRSILLLLMRESPRVVSKEELVELIWDGDMSKVESLKSHIYSLRNAIDRSYKHKLLKTIPRAGYQLCE